MKRFRKWSAVTLAFGVFTSMAWAQWSSDPMANFAVANRPGDQVQSKVLPLSSGGFYVSWFDNNPRGNPPFGYDVYVQSLDAGGVEQFLHNGVQVADLGLSSTEDYGLDVDTSGNALLAFLDDREGSNEQVTAEKVSPSGELLWGTLGIQLTSDSSFHGSPKITGTSDGDVVVAWISESNTVLQKLDPNGVPLWGSGVELSESGANYSLADLHATDDGAVIVSWVRDTGFTSNKLLYANKLSSTGSLMWGASHVKVFDGGSLQFGEFPYFILDGSGGAVFSWYSSSPTLQCYAQHILADGSEGFPHNGSVGSTNLTRVRVSPAVAYRAATSETFLFWTEQNSLQSMDGVYGQKFDSTGTRQWSDNGVQIVPLGSDSQIFVKTVQVGDGAQVFWVDEPTFGSDTIQSTQLDAAGNVACAQFPVSSLVASKSRPFAAISPAGLSVLAWEDNRGGDYDIYVQDLNSNCSLGYLPLQCSNLTRARAQCSSGNVEVALGLSDLTHDGDSVTVNVNGVDNLVPIRGQRAILSVPGQGTNTIQISNPASCAQQKVLQCP